MNNFMKKTILLFVFDGFADWGTSYAMAELMKMNAYHIKTIALEKIAITTAGGVCILPDLDFRPSVDLVDFDPTTTALIILPGGDAWLGNRNNEILLLIEHCIHSEIPIAAIGDAAQIIIKMNCLNKEFRNRGIKFLENTRFGKYTSCVISHRNMITEELSPIEFAMSICRVLNTKENSASNAWFNHVQNAIEV